MGQKDLSEKLLEDYSDVFADIVNVLLFHGNNTVKEEDLIDSGTKSQYKADDTRLHEQERDIMKIWKKQNVSFAVIGLENQTAVDNDMPLRIIGYDGASYRAQMLRNGNERYPVITLVLYFGDSPWSGPRSLFECFSIPDELKGYVNDYRIHIVDIPSLSEEQVAAFKSDFRIIADYFRQIRNNNGIYIPSRQEFRHTDAVLKFFGAFTSDQRFIETAQSKKEVRNMCDVLDRAEEQGIKKGREQERECLIRNALANLTIEQTAHLLKLPIAEVQKVAKKTL